jgi:hypothetical protein
MKTLITLVLLFWPIACGANFFSWWSGGRETGSGDPTPLYLIQTATVPSDGDTTTIKFNRDGRYGTGGIDDFELTVGGTAHDLLLYDGEFTDEHYFFIGDSVNCAVIPDADVNQNPDNTDAYWDQVRLTGISAAGGLIADAVDDSHYIDKDGLLSAGTKYFFSAKLKAGTETNSVNFGRLMIYDDDEYRAAFFDLANGTVGTESNIDDAGISSVDSDGYYRCWITATITTVTSHNTIYVMPSEADSDPHFSGDASDVSIYVKDINLMPVWDDTVDIGQVCTFDYDQPTNGAETLTGTDLSSVVADAVNNNSIQGDATPPIIVAVSLSESTGTVLYNENVKAGAGGIDDFEATIDGTARDLLLYDGEFTNEHSFYIADSVNCAVIPDADVNQNPDNTDAYWAQRRLTGISAAGGLIANAEEEGHYIYKDSLLSAGTKYFLSAKLKAGAEADSVDFAQLMFRDDDENRFAFFDLTNGTVETEKDNDDAGISTVDSDGYYRCWITATITTVTSYNRVYVLAAEADLDDDFAGDASDVSIYVKDINLMPVWSSTVGAGEVCTLDYDQPTNGFQDINGNDLADVTSKAINNTVPGSDPILLSMTLGSDGFTWTQTYSESVTVGAGGSAGYTLEMTNAGAVPLTYSSGSPSTTLVFTSTTQVYNNDTIADGLDYTQPGNGIEATDDDTDVTSYTDFGVITSGGPDDPDDPREPEPSQTLYCTQSGAGSNASATGTFLSVPTSAAQAMSAAQFNNANNWDEWVRTDGSKIGPDTTVYFSGTFTTQLTPYGCGHATYGNIILDGYEPGDCEPVNSMCTSLAVASGGILLPEDSSYLTIKDFMVVYEITWDNYTDPVDGFIVYTVIDDETYTDVINDPDATSYMLDDVRYYSGLTCGFYVTAFNDVCESDESDIVEFTFPEYINGW